MSYRGKFRGGILLAATLAGGLELTACQPSTTSRPVLDAWLTCIECSDGELDSVKAVAARLPGTIDTLREDLLHGPTAPRRARLVQQLQTTYQELVTHNANDPTAAPLPFTQVEFVNRYLDGMVAIYQGRAAYALGAIGTTPARQALDSALHFPVDSFSPGVLARIHNARDSLIGP